MDTGFGRIAVGIGTLMSLSAAQPTIMDDGSVSEVPDGAGFADTNGPPPGSPGEKAMSMSVGLLSRPKPTSL
jgi:hypothetical protein